MRQRRGVDDGRTERLAPNAKLRWAFPLHEATATPCVAYLPVGYESHAGATVGACATAEFVGPRSMPTFVVCA
eukprot:3975931-Pleurochrysis_carterae.AAC.1